MAGPFAATAVSAALSPAPGRVPNEGTRCAAEAPAAAVLAMRGARASDLRRIALGPRQPPCPGPEAASVPVKRAP